MELMSTKKVRHFLDNEIVVGIISMSDVVKFIEIQKLLFSI
jgi:hypothetical protein